MPSEWNERPLDRLLAEAQEWLRLARSLLHSAVNVKLGKSEDRTLLTGVHTVRMLQLAYRVGHSRSASGDACRLRISCVSGAEASLDGRISRHTSHRRGTKKVEVLRLIAL